jgi:hypothetical protein
MLPPIEVISDFGELMGNSDERLMCSLCNIPLRENEGYKSFNFNYVEEDDPLWGSRDSSMHHQCFQTWELKARYIEKFNEKIGGVDYSGKIYHMNEDGQIETKASSSE